MLNIIEKLEKFGYEININEGISYKTANDDIPKDEVTVLLSELKTNKYEAIKYLKKREQSQKERVLESKEELLIQIAKKLKESENLRSEINLYIKEETKIDKDILLNKLLKLASLLCNEELFYTMNSKRLKNKVYKEGVKNESVATL